MLLNFSIFPSPPVAKKSARPQRGVYAANFFFASTLKPSSTKNLHLTPSIRLDRTISLASHLPHLLLFVRPSQCLASKTVCLPNPKLSALHAAADLRLHLVHTAQKLSSFFRKYWPSFIDRFVLVREELSACMAWSPFAMAFLPHRRHHCREPSLLTTSLTGDTKKGANLFKVRRTHQYLFVISR
jgi:hypothetical protein